MTQSVSLAETNDQRGFDVLETLPRLEPTLGREKCDLCGSPRLTRAHETLAAETRMLLRRHPVYPAVDYLSDQARLLEPLERRDPRTTGSDRRAPAPLGAAHRRRACARDRPQRSRELRGGESHG